MTSKRIATALLVAFTLVGCSGPRPVAHTAPRRSAEPVQLAVLGDSLALGTGAGDSSGGFAFRVYRSIEATRPGSEITNFAIGGSTAADVLRLQTGRLRGRHVDLVMLCVGGNDVVRGVPTDAFARSFRDLVAAVRRNAPAAALVVIGVPDVSISPIFADRAATVRDVSRADDRAARAAATAGGASYVDLFRITQGNAHAVSFLSQDRFHPSDAGHAAIAASTLPVVERALVARARRAPFPGRRPSRTARSVN